MITSDFVLILSDKDFLLARLIEDPIIKRMIRRVRFAFDVYLADITRAEYWEFTERMEMLAPELGERLHELGMQQEPDWVRVAEAVEAQAAALKVEH